MKRHHVLVAAALLVVGVAVALFVAFRSRPSPPNGDKQGDESTKPPEPFPTGPGFRPPTFAWQGDEHLLGVGSTHYAVWETKTGKQLVGRKHIHAGPGQLAESVISPDGKRLVLGAEPKQGVGRILSPADGKSLPLAAPDKGEAVSFVSWSPDGGRLLFIDAAQILHLWDAATGTYVGKLGGPADDSGAGQMTFLPPRNQNRQDQNVYFANRNWVTNPEPKKQLAWVKPTWSPDGRYLLTVAGLEDNWSSAVVVVRNGRTGAALASLTVPGQRPSQWAFSPDGSRLALISSVMLGGHTSRAVIPWDEDIHSLSFVNVPRDAIALRLIDPETGATLHRLDGDFTPYLFAWSPDSKRLLVASKHLAEGARGRELTCWDAVAGRPLWSVLATPESSTAMRMVFSPDGKHAALTTRRKGPHKQTEEWAQEEAWLQVVAVDSGIPILESKLGRPLNWGREIRLWHKYAPLPLWAPSGNLLFVGSRVWEVPSGKVLLDLLPKRADESEPTVNGAWAPSGKLLATWRSDPPVHLWSVEDGKELRQLPEEKQGPSAGEQRRPQGGGKERQLPEGKR